MSLLPVTEADSTELLLLQTFQAWPPILSRLLLAEQLSINMATQHSTAGHSSYKAWLGSLACTLVHTTTMPRATTHMPHAFCQQASGQQQRTALGCSCMQ